MNYTICNINKQDIVDIEWKIKVLMEEIEGIEDLIYETKSSLKDMTDLEAITYRKEELANLIKVNEETWKEAVRLIARKKEMVGDYSCERTFITFG